MNKSNKIVVFDLDETLGYFTEFGIFCDCLNKYFNNNAYSDTHFNTLLELYPEFLRPKIIPVMEYLKKKKQEKKCDKIMIYTNNNGPKSWAKHISQYFDSKVKYKLFDQIIAAFKIRGEKIELGRTTHDKTVEDLFRCTKLPDDIEICFIDDIYHDGMTDERVYYINVKPYHHKLKVGTMIERFLQSVLKKDVGAHNREEFIDIIKHEFAKYHYTYNEKSPDEQEIDVIIGKKMFQHLKQFFYENNNKTLRHKKNSVKTRQNKTAKMSRTKK